MKIICIFCTICLCLVACTSNITTDSTDTTVNTDSTDTAVNTDSTDTTVNTDSLIWCIEKGIMQKINDQLDPEGFATYEDFIRFLVQYHSKVNFITFKTDDNNSILPYLEYALEFEILSWIDYDETGDITDMFQKELAEPFNTFELVTNWYSAIPDFEFELIHNAEQLSTIDTQDEFGRGILNLYNAGILEESNQDFHWNRVLTRAEFANIVDRIYNPQHRRD